MNTGKHLLSIIAVVLMVACSTGPHERRGPSDIDKAEVIEHGFLMSDLFLVGITKRMEERLEGPEKDELVACFNDNSRSAVGRQFAIAITNALSGGELDEGYAIAKDPVFRKVNRFILDNYELLADAYYRSPKTYSMSEYLLVSAGERMRVSESENEQIHRLVRWHRLVSERVSKGLGSHFPAIIGESTSVLTACAMSQGQR